MSIDIHHGDMLQVLPTLAADSFHACVTDPPYGIKFMGKAWDRGVPGVPFWAEVLRVLKPGAHLVAFGGTRTSHRMAVAIEDAGFELRDTLMWLYASGFPKSHSTNKALGDKVCACEEAESSPECSVRSMRDGDVSPSMDTGEGRRKVLQPRLPEQSPSTSRWPESPSDARVSESSMEGRGNPPKAPRKLRDRAIHAMPAGFDFDGTPGWLRDGTSSGDGSVDRASFNKDGMRSSSGPSPAEQRPQQPRTLAGQSQSQDGGAWPLCSRCGKPRIPDGLGTALKPAWEPIILARKPLIGTVAANMLTHGCGALNIDGCRVRGEDAQGGNYTVKRLKPGATLEKTGGNWRPEDGGALYHGEMKPGRWPANVLHDGSDEVIAAFPDAPGQQRFVGAEHGKRDSVNCYGNYGARPDSPPRGDVGSAARFFYAAKADATDRLSSKHPTVKPVVLMRYLTRLVTPIGGTVLDCFAGSGTTGMACLAEGFNATLIEREAEYVADIRRRIDHVHGTDAPLFAEPASADMFA